MPVNELTPAARLKASLAARRLTFGSWLSFADPYLAEMMVRLGEFDWLVVDMEHSGTGLDGQAALIQTIDLAGAVPLVRVGDNQPFMIKRALDAGAAGVIVPQVNSADDARRAVDAALYPPAGTRGVGLFRAQGFGMDFDAYRDRAAEETIVIVQIEHVEAVARIEEILDVEGVDGFLVGPYDLSGSVGKPGRFDDPEVRALVEKIGEVLGSHPKPGGFHVVHSDPDAVAQRVAQGARLIAYGTEMIFLAEKLTEQRAELRAIREVSP